jgi:plastocyanin
MRLPKLAAATVMAALLAACGPSSEPLGEVGTGPGGAGAVKIVARDTFFEPESLELTAGEEITVEVTNNGDTAHDFAIEELDLNTGTIEPGTTKTTTFKVPAGTTKFACTYHSGMEGTIEAD